MLTGTLWRSWKRTAVLTGCSSPSTVVDMTEEPRMVPKYLLVHRHVSQTAAYVSDALEVGLWTELCLRDENAAWNDV